MTVRQRPLFDHRENKLRLWATRKSHAGWAIQIVMIKVFTLNFINHSYKFYETRKLFCKSFEVLWRMNPETVQTWS